MMNSYAKFHSNRSINYGDIVLRKMFVNAQRTHERTADPKHMLATKVIAISRKRVIGGGPFLRYTSPHYFRVELSMNDR